MMSINHNPQIFGKFLSHSTLPLELDSADIEAVVDESLDVANDRASRRASGQSNQYTARCWGARFIGIPILEDQLADALADALQRKASLHHPRLCRAISPLSRPRMMLN